MFGEFLQRQNHAFSMLWIHGSVWGMAFSGMGKAGICLLHFSVLGMNFVFPEALCATQENLNDLSALTWESHALSYEGDETGKRFLDRPSQAHITQRRKCSTLTATSTPSSGVAISPLVGSTQAARWSTTKDSSSSSKTSTQPQLTFQSCLVSPIETTVIPDRKSSGKEVFCDQPQAEEFGCGVETDPSYSQVLEFVPVKLKSKRNCKTGEKTTVKKASTGKKKTNAIKNNAESCPDLPQGEESAQNAKELLQPKAETCSSKYEVSEMRQKACVGAFDRKNRDCGAEECSRSPDKVQDLRRTYEVHPEQLHSLGSGDSLQQEEIQSVESLSKSPVCTLSSHEVPSDASSLQNSVFLRKETSSTCALQEDSSVSAKSIKKKINRKTRVIRQRDDCDENLPNSVKIPEAKAKEQPKRSQTRRKTALRKRSCGEQRNKVDGFGPRVDVQEIAKQSTKDSPGVLTCSRKTYVYHPLDLAENLGCVQTYFKQDEIVPTVSIPESKASKIPRVQRIVAAQSNKKQTEDLQDEVHNMKALKKDAYAKLNPQRKRNISSPPETDSLAKQSVLTGKFSSITDLLSGPDIFLEEQIAEISLAKNLLDVSRSFESSFVTCSPASPVSSRLTDVLVSKSLSTEGNRMPERSSVQPESPLIIKEITSDEIPGERKQVESSSQSTPSQEPGRS